jgi:EpsD family peptidyl-prolyl cis-trans isomerase
MKKLALFGYVLPCLAFVACDSGKPEGQVIATANGEEITRQEFNGALERANVDAQPDKNAARRAVLDQLVMRKLIVQSAKKDGLDKSPEYIELNRQASDDILAGLFTRKITNATSTPYDHDVNKFINDNPTRFANREILLLDQIRAPAAKVRPEWVKDAKSLDEIAGTLRGHAVNFERERAALDSATLDGNTYKRIVALRGDQPFVVTQNGLMLFNIVVGHQPAPMDEDTARDAARKLMLQESNRAALANRLRTLRQSANIQYQAGFGPPGSTAPNKVQ